MSSQNSQLGQTLYDGAATAGRGMSLIALIIGILVSVILCIVGGVLLSSSTDSEWTSTYATVTNSPCSSSSSSPINSCLLMLSYTAGTVKMTNIPLSATGTTIYVTGSTIEIQYKNSDPSVIRYVESSSTILGIVSSVIAAVVTLIVVAQYFLTRKSKVYAAASGVTGLVNIFRHRH
jgi:hypothetical protein